MTATALEIRQQEDRRAQDALTREVGVRLTPLKPRPSRWGSVKRRFRAV